jgi:hypothetical protein
MARHQVMIRDQPSAAVRRRRISRTEWPSQICRRAPLGLVEPKNGFVTGPMRSAFYGGAGINRAEES